MKKIISFLIVPLLALTTLFGCSKVEYNANVLSTSFSTFMDSYISNNANLIFKNNILPSSSENDEGDLILVGETYVPTYEKIMYITYDNAYNLNTSVNANTSQTSSKVAIQASQLKTVYQRLLSLIYNYYSNWSGNFFATIKETGITQKEWESLSEDLHDLKQTTDTFLENKLVLEREVKMSGGVNGGLVETSFNNFNTHYNKLILSSLKFVNNFKDLHKKYIFRTDDITPSSAKRLVDEASLLLAEAIFYDNVLAFQKSEITEIYNLVKTYNASNYVWLTKSVWDYLIKDTEKGIYANANTNARVNEESEAIVGDLIINKDADSAIRNQAIEKIKQLKLYVSSFEQNLKSYKSIFANTNMQNYNSERGLVLISSGYDFEKLSAKEKSNIQYLLNFSYDRIGTMFASLYQVMEKNY